MYFIALIGLDCWDNFSPYHVVTFRVLTKGISKLHQEGKLWGVFSDCKFWPIFSFHIAIEINLLGPSDAYIKVDSRLALSQWETSLQSNAVSHWLGANLQSTLIYVSVKYGIIGSDNGLLPSWHQAIIWSIAGILLIVPLGINFSEISNEIHRFSFKKMGWNDLTLILVLHLNQSDCSLIWIKFECLPNQDYNF